MRVRNQYSMSLILVGVAWLTAVSAAVADEDAGAESGSASNDTAGAGPKEKDRRKSVRMPFLTAALEGGLVFYGDYEVSAKDGNGETQKLDISSRSGILLKLQINLLGSGLGIEINPLFAGEWIGHNEIEKLSAVGAQFGIAYRFHIRRFYPKIGIGGHLAYLYGDNIKRGLEAYGRLPVGFSVYFVRFLAFELEVAWMSGVTGLRTEGLGVFDNISRYDYTNGLEVVIGLRFP